MNKVVYVLLGLSLAANGYFLLNHNAQEGKVVIKETTVEKQGGRLSEADQIIQSTSTHTNDIIENKKFYLDKIAELENELALLKQQNDDDIQLKDNQVESVRVSRTRKVDEKILEEFERYNPKEMFESQSVDPEWAFEHQDEIYELITNSELMTQLNVSDVKCKTSVCKISLETFQDKHSAKMMAMMDTSELLRKNELLSQLSSQTSLKPGTNELYMYLFKEDEEAVKE